MGFGPREQNFKFSSFVCTLLCFIWFIDCSGQHRTQIALNRRNVKCFSLIRKDVGFKFKRFKCDFSSSGKENTQESLLMVSCNSSFALSVDFGDSIELKKNHVYSFKITISSSLEFNDSTIEIDFCDRNRRLKDYILPEGVYPNNNIGSKQNTERFLPFTKLTSNAESQSERSYTILFVALGGEKIINLFKFKSQTELEPIDFTLKSVIITNEGPIENYGDITNLVGNGDFELRSYCPVLTYQYSPPIYLPLWTSIYDSTYDCIKWRNAKTLPNTKVNMGSPDLYCEYSIGSERLFHPYNGICNASLFCGPDPQGAEYVQTKLRNELIMGERYRLAFNYRRATFSKYDMNLLGVKFSECPFSMDSLYQSVRRIVKNGRVKYSTQQPSFPSGDTTIVLPDNDQLSVWREFEYIFIASGDEKYLTIGPFQPIEVQYRKLDEEYYDESFRTNAYSVHYHIDNVRLVRVID